MGRGAFLKAAAAERQAGSPSEEIFQKYRGQVWPENALAMAIASVPDAELKRRHAVLNHVLVGLLILAASSKAAVALFLFKQFSIFIGIGAVILGVLAPTLFAIGIGRFDGKAYPLLMLLSGANMLNVLAHIPEYRAWVLVDLIPLVLIFLLAFIQKRNIFPNIGILRVKKDDRGNYIWGKRPLNF